MSRIITAFAALLGFLICVSSFAAESRSQQVKHALGLNLGSVVGNGIVYRHYLGGQYIQGTFAGYVDKDNDEEYLDASLSYVRYLKVLSVGNFGYPVGIKWISGGEVVYDQYESESDNLINIGTGVGLDFGSVQTEGFLLSFDLIYTLTYEGLKAREFNSLALEPALGILYNF